MFKDHSDLLCNAFQVFWHLTSIIVFAWHNGFQISFMQICNGMLKTAVTQHVVFFSKMVILGHEMSDGNDAAVWSLFPLCIDSECVEWVQMILEGYNACLFNILISLEYWLNSVNISKENSCSLVVLSCFFFVACSHVDTETDLF